jgi:hypothetical protein
MTKLGAAKRSPSYFYAGQRVLAVTWILKDDGWHSETVDGWYLGSDKDNWTLTLDRTTGETAEYSRDKWELCL